MSAIVVMVNGTERELAAETSVADLVAVAAPSPKGIAVAVNAELVPRSTWGDTRLCDGDRIEVLTAAQGG